MKLLMIGATGYIGRTVATSLTHAGHHIVPLLRPHEELTGATEHRRGDLTDPASLLEAVTDDIDGIVHVGAPVGDWNKDTEAVRTMLQALRPDGRFIYLSGTWVLGASTTSRPLTEATPPGPIAIVDGREKVETTVLTSDRLGVVVRAGIVHGHAGGIPALMTEWARTHGKGRYVADDTDPSWAVVHVDDLADLIGLALVEAPGGTLLHAVAEPGVPVSDIAAAADRAVGGPGRSDAWPLTEASAHLGAAFAGALALNQHVTATRAASLGWQPRRAGIVDELVSGSYHH